MKKLFRKLRINSKNKGFSLLEVLLAIAILALIATPVFNTIVSSYKMNLKSRKILAASDIVNATMEYASNQTMDDYKYSVPSTTNPGTFIEQDVKGLSTTYFNGSTYLKDFSTNKYMIYPHSTIEADNLVHTNGTIEDLDKAFDFTCPKINTLKKVYVERFTDVSYNGYHFDVIVFRCSPATTTDKYYTCDFAVAVYDHELKDADGKLIKYTEAVTKIPNVK